MLLIVLLNGLRGGMADPEHGLVAAIVFNGMPGEEKHAHRMREALAAVYEDLALV